MFHFDNCAKFHRQLCMLYESNKSLYDRLKKVGGDVEAHDSRRVRRGSLDANGDDDDDDIQLEPDVIRRDNWLL